MATLENALIGAVASSIANVTVYPLDLSKTLIQSQLKKGSADNGIEEDAQKDFQNEQPSYQNTFDCIAKIYKKKGFFGLYQGMSISIVGNFIQTFFYFFLYSLVKTRYRKIKGSRLNGSESAITINTFEELSLGIVAAIISQLFTNPVSVISTKQQTTKTIEEAKFLNVIRQIYNEHSGDIRGFWTGFKVSMVLAINPSITYASYQKLKNLLVTAGNDQLSAMQNFSLGVVSKIISTVITQPLIVSKVLLQATESKFSNFQDVLYYLYTREGLLSLWKGVGPQLSKGVVVQGLLFMFRGEITKLVKRLVYLRSLRSKV